MDDLIVISAGGLRLELCRPMTYYRGTRFDHAGVFRRIIKDGYVYADEWFDGDDPFRHDRVCGPSEEFFLSGFHCGGAPAAPGGAFIKPGVGLLRRPDEAPYDWFRLYEIIDPGRRSEEISPSRAVFRQSLDGVYVYEKAAELLSDSAFRIFHRLHWLFPEPFEGWNYNHNFFTFGGAPVGPSREIDFPFLPEGSWRSEYKCVGLVSGASEPYSGGIRFSAPVEPPSVYMGNLHSASGETPCEFVIREAGRSVSVRGDRPAEKMVFWSSPRVACIEPYIPLRLAPGETLEWALEYHLG